MQMRGGSGCAIRQSSSWSRWIRAQGSLHDIIGEDENAREEAVQEDENKVDQKKGDVEEIRSRHADDTTKEHENKTPFFLEPLCVVIIATRETHDVRCCVRTPRRLQ